MENAHNVYQPFCTIAQLGRLRQAKKGMIISPFLHKTTHVQHWKNILNLNKATNWVTTGRHNILLVSIYNFICLRPSKFLLGKMDIHLITIKICIVSAATKDEVTQGTRTRTYQASSRNHLSLLNSAANLTTWSDLKIMITQKQKAWPLFCGFPSGFVYKPAICIVKPQRFLTLKNTGLMSHYSWFMQSWLSINNKHIKTTRAPEKSPQTHRKHTRLSIN